jgi:hypothetical protein
MGSSIAGRSWEMGRVANRELAAQWRQRIAAQGRSGLTVAEFCRQQGVSIGSFYCWKQRVLSTRSRRGSSPAARPSEPARRSTTSPIARFVPLPLTGSESGTAIVIECRNGLLLRVPCDERSLRTVLAVLDERPC